MTFVVGCSGSLNDVGKSMGGSGGDDPEGTAGTAQHPHGGGHPVAGTSNGGSDEEGGYGGSGYGGTGYGGTDYVGGYGGTGIATGGYGGWGYGGTEYVGGYGGSGIATGGFGGSTGFDCFDAFATFGDESSADVGPQNTVLLDVHAAQSPITNSANQLVFPSSFSGQWEAYANFPGVSAELAAKTDISLPADLASLPDNLAQFYVARRNCEGLSVAGHKLLVEVWWKSGEATAPTHGFALGVYDKKKKLTSWLPDATKSFVVGTANNKRVMDTLNRIQLTHTFAATDKTDPRQLVLGLWLASEDIQATTFYVGNVHWD
jgi:hypothetical protein